MFKDIVFLLRLLSSTILLIAPDSRLVNDHDRSPRYLISLRRVPLCLQRKQSKLSQFSLLS
jgi:hypothetical protein